MISMCHLFLFCTQLSDCYHFFTRK
uniref:Uncharacterized protein n=1 Tax=Anguilla anguilla TaxID=7936 RepID=A0A0E9P9C5_ANGAN